MFADLARGMTSTGDVQQTWQHVVDLCPKTVSACEHASASVIHGRDIRTDASTGELAAQADAIQYETGQGPSLDAIRLREPLRTGDLACDQRWPSFAARVVVETALCSMLSFPLVADETTLGALTFYSTRADAFDEADMALGAMLAAQAALAGFAALRAEETEQLREARDSNRRIGAAVGILMAGHNCSEEEAFQVLRRTSQHRNIKLREVAERVIASQVRNGRPFL